MLGKKGVLQTLNGLVLAIVMVTIVLGVGLMVLNEFANAMSGTSAYNATTAMIEKMGAMPTWIGIIIIVFMAGIVIRSLGVFGGATRE